MDLREIQRLHAQFASDAMIIDLPRQIAALPAPAALENSDKSSKLTLRMTGYVSALHSGAKPLLVAIVVAMAGVGAARVWHSVNASHVTQKIGVAQVVPEKSRQAVHPAVANEPAVRTIDATPPHPIGMAPVLSASDVSSAPAVGLTADQFRSSLGTVPRNSLANASTVKAAPTASNETPLAAVSPIRQPRRDSDPTQVVSAPRSQVMQTASKPTVQPAPQEQTNTAVVDGSMASASTQATEHRTSSPAPATQTHNYRRRLVRPHDEQPSESDTTPTGLNKKAATSPRAGANEVQMF